MKPTRILLIISIFAGCVSSSKVFEINDVIVIFEDSDYYYGYSKDIFTTTQIDNKEINFFETGNLTLNVIYYAYDHSIQTYSGSKVQVRDTLLTSFILKDEKRNFNLHVKALSGRTNAYYGDDSQFVIFDNRKALYISYNKKDSKCSGHNFYLLKSILKIPKRKS